MKLISGKACTLSAFLITCGILMEAVQADVTGWLHWRGPQQNGTTLETGLPDKLDVEDGNLLWSYDISGRGEVVIADGRVYSFGYKGEGPDLREYLTCLDENTGEVYWEIGFNDFLSDIVYSRYALGAPTVDPETGNIFLMTCAGEFVSVSPQGQILWRQPMMERFGLMTFPNGRRGAAVVDGDLVIHHSITSYWGSDGPARDRFYALNKYTGDLVWLSVPGTEPKDNSFSSPVLGWANGKRVLYSGTGDGNIICLNVRTGEPIWRYHVSFGGVNSGVLLHDDKVIAIHGTENIDSSEVGRMVAIRTGAEPSPGEAQLVLDKTYELWRNPLTMFSSSPVLVDYHVYQVTKTGELECVDANSGIVLSSLKLAPGQIHASPLYSEGKLYVPMEGGEVFVLRIHEDGSTPEIMDREQLEGTCLGAPSSWNGKVYIHTTAKLYCFGAAGDSEGLPPTPEPELWPEPGPAVALQIVPSDVLLSPGEEVNFTIQSIDANGFVVETLDASKVTDWESYIPPTARVQSQVNAIPNGKGGLKASDEETPSAGMFKATYNGLTGLIRGRILPSLPFEQDFESYTINQVEPEGHIEAGAEFAYPPLPWLGARAKWEVREVDGNKVLRKTLDRVLFQRAITFIGNPDSSNYTMQMDVMTGGTRRTKSDIGIINQRYFISLIGNAQLLEVNSNHERIKASVPYRWSQDEWHTLKARVDVTEDGSGVIRAKAWKRGETEPEGWMLEVPHKIAHKQGAPGIFGLTPQSLYPAFVDNIVITPND